VSGTSVGTVVTFYSYKGGVGRTLALANVAALLATWGYRVLCVDWDLEAPGLHMYFQKALGNFAHDGLVEWVQAYAQGERPDWRRFVREFHLRKTDLPVTLMSAGRQDDKYAERMMSLNWQDLYQSNELGRFIEDARAEWVESFDFILIDSRTGLTDIGGICTIQLPDLMVALFTANEQNVRGILSVGTRAREARNSLPVDRARLLVIPVPMRWEARIEYETAQDWLKTFSRRLEPFYVDWIHKDVTIPDILNVLKIPYVPFWSFGERLPVIERGTRDPDDIGYFFETLAAVLAHRLSGCDELVRNRDAYVTGADKVTVAASIERTSADVTAAATIQSIWQYQHIWAATEAKLRDGSSRWQLFYGISLTIGLALATLGVTWIGFSGQDYFGWLQSIGAVILGAAVIASRTQLTPERLEAIRRAGAVAGAIEREIYRFLRAAPPYDSSSQLPLVIARTQTFRAQVSDLGAQAAQADPGVAFEPVALTVEEYVTERLADQITWCGQSARHFADVARFRQAVEWSLHILAFVPAAIAGGLGLVGGGGLRLADWLVGAIPVMTTLVALYADRSLTLRPLDVAALRFEAGNRLQALRDRWVADSRRNEHSRILVDECETTIATVGVLEGMPNLRFPPIVPTIDTRAGDLDRQAIRTPTDTLSQVLLTSAWQQHASWGAAAVVRYAALRLWRGIWSFLLFSGALCGAVAAVALVSQSSTNVVQVLALTSAVSLAGALFVYGTRLSAEQVQRAQHLDAAAGCLDETLYRYLMAAPPFASMNAHAAGVALSALIQDISATVGDSYVVDERARSGPADEQPTELNIDEYLARRVAGNIQFYARRGSRRRHAAQLLQTISLGCALLAVLTAALVFPATVMFGGPFWVFGYLVAPAMTASAISGVYLAAAHQQEAVHADESVASGLDQLLQAFNADPQRYRGRGINQFVENVENVIAAADAVVVPERARIRLRATPQNLAVPETA
jgi:hypothetical protein